MDPVFTTPTRGSGLPPLCGWAEARAWSHKGENTANTKGINREEEEATGDIGEESSLQGTRLSCKFNTLALAGVHIASTGSFPHLNETNESELGLAHDLYKGNNSLKQLIISHRGRFHNSITDSTHFLLVGDLTVESSVEKHRVNYETIQNIIYGKLSISEALNIPNPETLAMTQQH